MVRSLNLMYLKISPLPYAKVPVPTIERVNKAVELAYRNE